MTFTDKKIREFNRKFPNLFFWETDKNISTAVSVNENLGNWLRKALAEAEINICKDIYENIVLEVNQYDEVPYKVRELIENKLKELERE